MARSSDLGGLARARVRGYTVTEIVVGLLLVSFIFIYLGHSFIFASRAEVATNKKLIAARALQYVQGRIRRDAKWARFARITGPGSTSPGSSGEKLDLSSDPGFAAGKTRTYSWDPETKKLTLPDLIDPANPAKACEYGLARFRKVLFYRVAGQEEVLQMVLSPVESDEKENLGNAQERQQRRLWGAAAVGQIELDRESASRLWTTFNDPAFTRLPADPTP